MRKSLVTASKDMNDNSLLRSKSKPYMGRANQEETDNIR